MNLLINTLKGAIAKLVEDRFGVPYAKVLHKVNKRGEMVIAVVLTKSEAEMGELNARTSPHE